MSAKQTEDKITALYERLSRDDDKSKGHKAESFLSDISEWCRFFYLSAPTNL